MAARLDSLLQAQLEFGRCPGLAHLCRSATSALTASFGGIAGSLCLLRVLRILTQSDRSTDWMSSLKVLRCSDTRQGHGPMRRRDFIATIAGIAALPLAAHAQQQAVPSIAQTASTDISKCAQNSVGFPQRLDGPRWNGWGADVGNSRLQPAAMAGLTRDQV